MDFSEIENLSATELDELFDEHSENIADSYHKTSGGVNSALVYNCDSFFTYASTYRSFLTWCKTAGMGTKTQILSITHSYSRYTVSGYPGMVRCEVRGYVYLKCSR